MISLSTEVLRYFDKFESDERVVLEGEILKALKKDRENAENWLSMSILTDSLEYKNKCLEAAIKLFQRQYRSRFNYQLDRDKNTCVLETNIVGISYDDRILYVSTLRIRERVVLVREPKNDYDPNAIKVTNFLGHLLGYLPRDLAAKLVDYFDRFLENKSLDAVVTEILCDSGGENYGVKISFNIPTSLIEADSESSYGLEQKADPYDANNIISYLNLDSSNELFVQLTKAIPEDLGLEIISTGAINSSSMDKEKFRWYIRFNNLTDSQLEKLETYLVKEFPLRSVEDENERTECLQKELEALQAVLQEKNELLLLYQSEVDDLEKKNNEATSEISNKDEEIANLDDQIKSISKKVSSLQYLLEQKEKGITSSVISAKDNQSQPESLQDRVDKFLSSFKGISAIKIWDVVEIFEKTFPDRLVFLDSAHSHSGQNFHFMAIEKLFKKLWYLSTEMYDHFNPDNDIRFSQWHQDNIWEYAGKMSENQNRASKKKITFLYRGKRIFMEQHLKIDNVQDEKQTLRIYFKWLQEEKKIIVGHCGKHL